MSSKDTRPARRSKKSKPKVPDHSPTPCLSDSDANALDAFCKGVTLDEVTITVWEECQTSLDLCVPLFLSPTDAESGGNRPVYFARTVKEREGAPPTRKPVSCIVTVPPAAKDGQMLTLPGEGDQTAERIGNLRVIIRIKRPS